MDAAFRRLPDDLVQIRSAVAGGFLHHPEIQLLEEHAVDQVLPCLERRNEEVRHVARLEVLLESARACEEGDGRIDVAGDILRGQIREEREAAVVKIGENIKIARNARMEVSGHGLIAAYIHTGAKVGVLVEVGAGKDSTVTSDEFKQLVKDITLQIAAGHPFAVSREQVAPEVIAKEREIAAQSDRLKGKPEQAMEKILQGVLEKFYQTYCLVDQGFVKRNSEISVKDYVGEVAKKLGDEITIRRFVRFQVGEATA